MRPLSLLVLAAFLAAAPAAAHPTSGSWTFRNAVVVTVDDDHGTGLGGRPFTVTAPGQAEPWLRGVTDPKGRVVFMPDRDGDWIVRVFGEDGHGAQVTVDLGSADSGVTGHDDHAGHDHHAAPSGHAAGDHANCPITCSVKAWQTIGGVVAVLAAFLVIDLIVRRRR